MTKSTRRIKPTQEQQITVAIDSPIIKEELPFNHVHYPTFYGTFFMFSETIESTPYFCECSLKAIENHFELRNLETNNSWSDNTISAPLSSHFFPKNISSESLTVKLDRLIQFKPKLCHRCNLSAPSLRYCHEMYGGNFKQRFGWYINQTSLRLGIRDANYIKDYTPVEYVDLIEVLIDKQRSRNELSVKNINFDNQIFEQIIVIDKEISKLRRSLLNKFENITREDFGFRKIGEGFVSETMLTNLVEKIFNGKTVLKHHRPKWLQGLELDIFLPELNLGIEYQGQQHFYPIKAWGGEKSLFDLQLRDQKKRDLCSTFGIRLIEFDYTEPLEIGYIKEKMCLIE